MNRSKVASATVALVLLVLAVIPAVAETPRPACDQNTSNNVCQASITVFAYVDRGRDRGSDAFFDSAIDVPLQGARITFAMPDGRWVQQVTTQTGFISLPNTDFVPGDEAFLEIEYPVEYRGYSLVPCVSSPVRRRVTPEMFGGLGALRIHFCAAPYVPAYVN